MTGLVGIFAHDRPRVVQVEHKRVLTGTLTDERERKRMAEAMWWGFRHYRTPAELSSFNHHQAVHLARPKPSADYIVPELFKSVVSRRAQAMADGCPVEEVRGCYPVEVERAVEALLDEQARARSRRSNVLDPNWDEK